MSRWERIVWIASWLAPVAWCAVFALFGLFVLWPSLRGLGDARLHAWALGICVLVALVLHILVMHHGVTTTHFSRDEKAELRWKLKVGRGYSHWRGLMRQHERTWYHGRSHTSARPRYD